MKANILKSYILPTFSHFCIYTLIFIMTVLSGCDVLDKQPLGQITEDELWLDESLVDAYVNEVYSAVNFSNGTGSVTFNQTVAQAMGAEVTMSAWQAPAATALSIIEGGGTGAREVLNRWHYSNIRRANSIIENISSSSDLNPDYVQQRVSEVRFLRAWMYFQMVKRYGGVPLITRVQQIGDPPDEIFVKRNSEQEIYDFIAAELDEIANILPDDNVTGRANRGAALALKSRAMLYAASIAEFGEIQLDGILGIPHDHAARYWKSSYDASIELINTGQYQLYNQYEDPVVNFQNIFLDKIGDNPEAIFGEIFDGQTKAHSFTFMALPEGVYSSTWGNNFGILYGLTELFDFIDGSSGKIPRNEVTNNEWSFDDFFGKRDPRFKASFYYPEVEVDGTTLYYHSSTIYNGETLTDGTIDGVWPAAAPTRHTNKTGMFLRKRVNESELYTGHDLEDRDFIVFRLGEIYLNLSEAAFHLGQETEALDNINIIRARAGMPLLSEISLEQIRHERQVELALEGHRYWDLRRWRIAEEVLNGLRTQGLKFHYNWDTKKYRIEFINAESVHRTFQERHYYLPLGTNRVTENPNFVENPGY